MRTIKLGSLFDGSGGFPLGGILAGIQPVWASEIEPFPIRVTTKRMPFIKHYGDVNKLCGDEIEPVDIITFGSPCTDLSIAGKREGLEGKQSGLFHQAIRVIKEMRNKTNGKYPSYIVFENVPGAFSSNKGEDFRLGLDHHFYDMVIFIEENRAEYVNFILYGDEQSRREDAKTRFEKEYALVMEGDDKTESIILRRRQEIKSLTEEGRRCRNGFRMQCIRQDLERLEHELEMLVDLI